LIYFPFRSDYEVDRETEARFEQDDDEMLAHLKPRRVRSKKTPSSSLGGGAALSRGLGDDEILSGGGLGGRSQVTSGGVDESEHDRAFTESMLEETGREEEMGDNSIGQLLAMECEIRELVGADRRCVVMETMDSSEVNACVKGMVLKSGVDTLELSAVISESVADKDGLLARCSRTNLNTGKQLADFKMPLRSIFVTQNEDSNNFPATMDDAFVSSTRLPRCNSKESMRSLDSGLGLEQQPLRSEELDQPPSATEQHDPPQECVTKSISDSMNPEVKQEQNAPGRHFPLLKSVIGQLPHRGSFRQQHSHSTADQRTVDSSLYTQVMSMSSKKTPILPISTNLLRTSFKGHSSQLPETTQGNAGTSARAAPTLSCGPEQPRPNPEMSAHASIISGGAEQHRPKVCSYRTTVINFPAGGKPHPGLFNPDGVQRPPPKMFRREPLTPGTDQRPQFGMIDRLSDVLDRPLEDTLTTNPATRVMQCATPRIRSALMTPSMAMHLVSSVMRGSELKPACHVLNPLINTPSLLTSRSRFLHAQRSVKRLQDSPMGRRSPHSPHHGAKSPRSPHHTGSVSKSPRSPQYLGGVKKSPRRRLDSPGKAEARAVRAERMISTPFNLDI